MTRENEPQPTPPAQSAIPRQPEARLFYPRLAEFLLLFAAIPTAMFFFPFRYALLTVLALGAIATFIVLRRDPTFGRNQLWGSAGLKHHAWSIIALSGVGLVGLTAGTLLFEPDRFLALPRNRTGLWALIMLLYPILSVYPQELIYRAFLMHRYQPVFPGKWSMIAASAAAFAYGHIIINNLLAVIMTLVGGALFAWRYQRSRSLAAVWLEHAIWGCLIFTIGLGAYFYAARYR